MRSLPFPRSSRRWAASFLAAAALLPSALEAQSWQEEVLRLRAEMEAMRSNYEERIQQLEEALRRGTPPTEAEPRTDSELDLQNALDELEETLEKGVESNRDIGQTTRFLNAFNPAFGLLLDFSGSASTLDESFDDYNRFRLRTGELSIAADIDPFTWGYGVLEFTEDHVGVAELAAVMSLDRFFPAAEWRIKGGKFFADLDPLNPIHEHDYAFVHQPAVKVALFGGNLVGNGLELHHWTDVGETTALRFSIGMLSDVEGESHAEFGHSHEHEHEEAEGRGRRDFENFTYTARASLQLELSPLETLSVGGSLAYSPEVREFEEDEMTGQVERIDMRQVVESVDLSYQSSDGAGRSLQFTNAWFFSQGRFVDETTGLYFHENAYGTYAFLDWAFHPVWSAGAAFDYTTDLREADRKIVQYSAFLTWRLSPLNRLRLQVQHTDVDRFDEGRFPADHTTLFLQWTLNLGTHAHSSVWARSFGG